MKYQFNPLDVPPEQWHTYGDRELCLMDQSTFGASYVLMVQGEFMHIPFETVALLRHPKRDAYAESG